MFREKGNFLGNWTKGLLVVTFSVVVIVVDRVPFTCGATSFLWFQNIMTSSSFVKEKMDQNVFKLVFFITLKYNVCYILSQTGDLYFTGTLKIKRTNQKELVVFLFVSTSSSGIYLFRY